MAKQIKILDEVRHKKSDIMEFFGTISDKEANRLRKVSKEFRRNVRLRRFR